MKTFKLCLMIAVCLTAVSSLNAQSKKEQRLAAASNMLTGGWKIDKDKTLANAEKVGLEKEKLERLQGAIGGEMVMNFKATGDFAAKVSTNKVSGKWKVAAVDTLYKKQYLVVNVELDGQKVDFHIVFLEKNFIKIWSKGEQEKGAGIFKRAKAEKKGR